MEYRQRSATVTSAQEIDKYAPRLRRERTGRIRISKFGDVRHGSRRRSAGIRYAATTGRRCCLWRTGKNVTCYTES